MSESTSRTFWQNECSTVTPRDRRNLRRVNGFAVAWAAALCGATYLIKYGQLDPGPTAWAVASIPSIIALFAVLAFGRYLREADELQRTIQLQALALGVGAGFVLWSGYTLWEKLGASLDYLPDTLVVMVVFYLLGIFLGRRRYL